MKRRHDHLENVEHKRKTAAYSCLQQANHNMSVFGNLGLPLRAHVHSQKTPAKQPGLSSGAANSDTTHASTTKLYT